MEGNFNCSSCPLSASFFCICAPKKVYLCGKCIEVHCLKGGVHAIAPISAKEAVSKPQDIEGYNKRTQVVHELTAIIDQMCREVNAERDQLAGNLNAMYNEQASLLYSAYVKAGEDLDAAYRSFYEDLQSVKQEIQKCEQGQSKTFTKNTTMSVAAHIQLNPHKFVNLQEELSKRIKLRVVDIASIGGSLLAHLYSLRMNMATCQCQSCLFYQDSSIIDKTICIVCGELQGDIVLSCGDYLHQKCYNEMRLSHKGNAKFLVCSCGIETSTEVYFFIPEQEVTNVLIT